MLLQKSTDCNERHPLSIEVLNIREHPWHTHDALEIIYCLKGSINVGITIYRSTMTAGDVAAVNDATLHYLSSEEDNIVLLFHFNLAYFAALLPKAGDSLLICNSSSSAAYNKYYDILKHDLASILLHYYTPTSDAEENLRDSCMNCISTLVNHFDFLQHEGNRIYTETLLKKKPIQFERLKRIARYMYSNYDKRISLDELAQKEYVSKYYLSHLISDGFEMSFQSYLNLIRTTFAQEYLYGTSAPISEVAEKCGFSSTDFFRKTYMHYLNCSPSADRKRIIGHTAADAQFRDTDVLQHMDLETIFSLLGLYRPQPSVNVFSKEQISIQNKTIDMLTLPDTPKLKVWDTVSIDTIEQIVSQQTYGALEILHRFHCFSKVAVPLHPLTAAYRSFCHWDFLLPFLAALKKNDFSLLLWGEEDDIDSDQLSSLLEVSKVCDGPEIVVISSPNVVSPQAADPSDPIAIILNSIQNTTWPNLFKTSPLIPHLFGPHNLKASAFYAYYFLSRLKVYPFERDPLCRITHDGESLSILLLNPSPDAQDSSIKTSKYLFELKNIKRNYLCKIYTLSARHDDEVSIYRRLYPNLPLNRELKDLIQTKAFPEVDLFGIDAAPEYHLYISSHPDTATLIELS